MVSPLDPAQLRAELKQETLYPVYLFAGADGFRAERTARRIDSPWVLYECARQRALLLSAQGLRAEALVRAFPDGGALVALDERGRDLTSPDLADLIAGFPGETPEDFRASAELLERVRYDYAFLFRYSEASGQIAQGLALRGPDHCGLALRRHISRFGGGCSHPHIICGCARRKRDA